MAKSSFKQIRGDVAQALFDASLAVRGMTNPADLDAALSIIKNALTRAHDGLFPEPADFVDAEIIIDVKPVTEGESIAYECTESCGKTCPSAVERERTS